jgi:subfamily B ATP-binding cassette protein HlyB/CyaB
VDSGFFCLQVLGAFHQVQVDEASLRHDLSAHLETNSDGVQTFGQDAILLAAKSLGLTARVVNQDSDRLDKAPWPAIAQYQDGRFFVIAKYDPGIHPETGEVRPKVLIQHAGQPPEVLGIEDLFAQWTGEVIFFTSKANFSGALAKFDFTWFIPAIVKYRKLLGEILLVSLVLQLIGLVTPLFFQGSSQKTENKAR